MITKDDDIEAVKWFRIRAGKGDAGAQYTLPSPLGGCALSKVEGERVRERGSLL